MTATELHYSSGACTNRVFISFATVAFAFIRLEVVLVRSELIWPYRAEPKISPPSIPQSSSRYSGVQGIRGIEFRRGFPLTPRYIRTYCKNGPFWWSSNTHLARLSTFLLVLKSKKHPSKLGFSQTLMIPGNRRNKMPNQQHDIQTIDAASFPYIFEQNVSIPLGNVGVVHCNVYKPKTASMENKFPVLVTYGPYGKDVPYKRYGNRVIWQRPVTLTYITKDSIRKVSRRSTQHIKQSILHGRLRRLPLDKSRICCRASR